MTAPRPLAGPGAVALARWPGTCVACGGRFTSATPIVREPDGWAHEECHVDREQAAAEVEDQEAER